MNSGKPLLALWAKYSTRRCGSQVYFWGLNRNQLRSLNSQSYPWWLVLLFGNLEGSYLASASQVNLHIQRGGWPSQTSRPEYEEYKIHEKNIKSSFQKFEKFSEVFQALKLF